MNIKKGDKRIRTLEADKANLRWKDTDVLICGDSLSHNTWSTTFQTLTGCKSVTLHTLPGANIIQMVDGAPDAGYGALAALSQADVTGKELIIFFGGTNDRSYLVGNIGDLYPTQNTIAGKIQYAYNKIYTLLAAANNLNCKVVFVAPHCQGANTYITQTGYEEYPAMSGQSLKDVSDMICAVANHNNCQAVNLWRNSGIGANTWSLYAASEADKVHLNTAGYARIGECIALGIMNDTGITSYRFQRTSDYTLYVDASGTYTDGSNTYSAFTTIAAALLYIPYNLNGINVTVKIAAGTYAASISLSNRVNGKVIFYFAGNTTLNGMVIENSNVELNSPASTTLDINTAGGGNGIYALENATIRIKQNLTVTMDTGATGLISKNMSTIFLEWCANALSVSNTTGQAIYVDGGTIISMRNIAGSGNTLGYKASGGFIRLNTNTLTATTLVSKLVGGQVITGAGVDLA